MKTLAVCSPRPNCVSSLATDAAHRLPPICYTGSLEAAEERLRQVIRLMPRSKIVTDETGYLSVEFRSKVFGFVDDAEFAFDEKGGVINFRSGSRSGYYDFGVNRSRLEEIRKSFEGPRK